MCHQRKLEACARLSLLLRLQLKRENDKHIGNAGISLEAYCRSLVGSCKSMGLRVYNPSDTK